MKRTKLKLNPGDKVIWVESDDYESPFMDILNEKVKYTQMRLENEFKTVGGTIKGIDRENTIEDAIAYTVEVDGFEGVVYDIELVKLDDNFKTNLLLKYLEFIKKDLKERKIKYDCYSCRRNGEASGKATEDCDIAIEIFTTNVDEVIHLLAVIYGEDFEITYVPDPRRPESDTSYLFKFKLKIIKGHIGERYSGVIF